MNRPWIVAGLFAVAGAIVFQAWWPGYSEAKNLESQARMTERQRREDCQFQVAEEMNRVLEGIKSSVTLQEAARWANCDPTSSFFVLRCSKSCVVVSFSTSPLSSARV